MRYPIVLALAVLFALTSAHAAIRKVPSQFATIADALAVAVPGDEIVVSKGKYTGNILISGKSGITLRAKGKVVLEGVGGPLAPIAPPSVVFLDGCTNVTLLGFRVTAPSVLLAIRVSVCTDCRILKCRTNGGGTGIFGNALIRQVIEDCTVKGPSFTGIDLGGDSCLVTGCKVVDPGNDGIRTRLTDGRVENNSVKGAGRSGIAVDAFEGKTIVMDNDVEGSATTAFFVDGTAPTGLFIGNRVRGGGDGASVMGSAWIIADNDFLQTGGAALTMSEADMITFENRTKKCDAGLVIEAGGANGSHTGNSFKKCATNAVEIKAGAVDNFVSDNVAKKSGQFDLLNNGDATNEIFDNQFTTVGP